MKQSVILNTSQVTRLKETGSVVVVDAVKMPSTVEEPTFGYTAFTPPNHISLRGYFNWVEDGELRRNYGEKLIKLPYALNSTVYVREKWHDIYYNGLIDYIFQTDTEKIDEIEFACRHDEEWDGIKWQSPATMPKSAARFFPVVEKVQVVRCRDFLFPTYQELEQFYFKCGIKKIPLSKPYGVNEYEFVFDWKDVSGTDEHLYNNCLWSARAAFGNMIASRFGHSFWDNNGWIFLTQLKLNK